ncbi:hypothetical protein Patl1_02231 [Pistacia atlantica]|uniref:Uncharacterized protein n=1 Tax=Pistacia atlantica TaxID=434234 RepID=A0ACC1CCT2_9ROSI|nr:hypothetical protein Patl1_02231 [Pistacia atlantica]
MEMTMEDSCSHHALLLSMARDALSGVGRTRRFVKIPIPIFGFSLFGTEILRILEIRSEIGKLVVFVVQKLMVGVSEKFL